MAARIKVTDLPDNLQRKFRAEVKQPRKLKYRNCPTFVDGMKFDSKKEAQRYGTLKQLERLGEIRDLRCQVPFQLVVNSFVVGKIILDFTYVGPHGIVYEDVKGGTATQTPVFRWKARHFQAQYGAKISLV